MPSVYPEDNGSKTSDTQLSDRIEAIPVDRVELRDVQFAKM